MGIWRSKKHGRKTEIRPDEIFIDSQNVQDFNLDQFEGRIERPLGVRSLWGAGLCVVVLLCALLVRAGNLQIAHGASYAQRALNNQLQEQVIFADRGIIADRTGVPLAYNERTSVSDDFATRIYAAYRGLSHAVGYVKPPAKDTGGQYFREEFIGLDGAEKAFNTELAGQNGLRLTETDAHGAIISQSITQPPQDGRKITLSLDAKVSQGLYDALAARAQASNFQGGAGVIMDVQTGELIVLTSYPEYSQNALQSGDAATIRALNASKATPFLDRAVDGLYAPGSIVKPIVAAAALAEGVISEDKQILSTGSISVPNLYDKMHPSIFKDWRVNGWTDMRHAIAVSSDVYFYEVGGGFESQAGLGIALLDRYFTMFGFGQDAGLAGFSKKTGTIPTPAWKAVNFPQDPTWRIGDTYHTAIGQYGVQITSLQAVREAAAIANGGVLLAPTLIASSTPQGVTLLLPAGVLQVVREGMRLGVVEGIAQSVKFDLVHVAAKTGTAQIGIHNEYVNSWMIGFFPYERPRYAFAVVLERGPAGTLQGAPAAMNTFLQWIQQNAPRYLE